MLSIFIAKYNKNIVDTIISRNNFISIFEEMPIGVFTYNQDLILTQANKALAKILQVPQEKLINLDLKKLKDKSILEPLKKVFKNEKGYYKGPYQTTLSNIKIWIQLNAIPMYNAEGNIIAGLGMAKDITKEVENQKKLEYQAFYDSLTGLVNKAFFYNLLKQFIKKLHRSNQFCHSFFKNRQKSK